MSSEEGIVVLRTFRVLGVLDRVESSEKRITETPIVLIVNIHDCSFLNQVAR